MTPDNRADLEAAAAAAGLRTERLECMWHVADAAPELVTSGLSLPDDTGCIGVPVPSSTLPFVEASLFRPPGSHRTFYHCPALVLPGGDPAVTAIKGMEPLLFTKESVGLLLQPCYSAHNIAEHLILEEGKIPWALASSEALGEAGRAAEVQRAHLAGYGHLAALPLPICVLRHRDRDVEAHTGLLAERLSAPARARMAKSAKQGFSVYLYRYPVPPLRADDLASILASRAFRERVIALLSIIDPETVIEGWTRLYARLLALGYLAGSLADVKSGIACQPQNACLDGGFVDAGSLTPIADLADDTALYAALDMCTRAMVETVRCLLTGREDPAGRPDGPGRFDLRTLSQYVTARILDALEQEAGTGAPVDLRVLSFFRGPKQLDEVWKLLGAYYTAGSSGFEEASRRHATDWIKLLRLAGGGTEGGQRAS